MENSRRKFLKGAGLAAAAASQAGAIDRLSNTVFTDDEPKMTASHFGAFKGVARNGRFEGYEPFEGDAHVPTLIQGVVARTYAQDRVMRPSVRKGYLEKGYKSDKSMRGKDEWVEVSWDKALDLVADELKRVYKEYGPHAIYGGSYGWYCVGSVNNPQALLGRMLNVAGGQTARTCTYSTHAIRQITPYVTGSDESSAKQTAWPVVIKNSEVVVMFGADPLNTNQIAWGVPLHEAYGYIAQLKEQMKKRGVRVITIDPVYNNTATYLNSEHISINPTTDVAMMLGMAYHLIEKNLYDAKFVKKYTSGFEDFRAYVMGETDKMPKTPKWASEICGVSEKEIKELAELCAKKRTMIMMGWGPQRAHHGEQPHWMAITLASMLGQIGQPGGGFGFAYHYSDGGVPSPAGFTGNALSVNINGSTGDTAKKGEAMSFPGLSGIGVIPAPEGDWKHRSNAVIPVSRIVECIENPGKEIEFDCKKITYPEIKMAYWSGGNPFGHHQDTNRQRKAWEKLDSFFVNECFWTATARMADIVLPACTEQERDDIAKAHTNKYIFAMHKIAEPVGEAKTDYWIFSEIMKRFGKKEFDAFTEGRTHEEWIRHFYETAKKKGEGGGLKMPSFEEFWAKGYAKFETPESANSYIKLADFVKNPITNRLGTPSGKIEIVSKKIAKAGYKDCGPHPMWFEPMEWLGSKLAKKYPLNMVTPHPKYRLHNQLDNTFIRDFENVQGREPIWIHPDDAKERGIMNGDVVRVFNDRGEVLAGAVVTSAVKKHVVRMQEGGWYDPDKDGLDRHGSANVLIPDVGTSELAQGNQATALVQIEKFKGELPAVELYTQPKIKRG